MTRNRNNPLEWSNIVLIRNTPDIVLSLRYLNTYRVPLIERIFGLFQDKHHSFVTLGAKPNKIARNNEDVGWHSTYRTLTEIKISLFSMELRFRLIPFAFLNSKIFITEHAAGNMHNIIIILCRKLLRKKTILMGHGYNITGSTTKLSRALERWQATNCDGYLAYTPNSVLRAIQLGTPPARTISFMNSTDTKSLNELLMQAQTFNNQESGLNKKFMYLGSLNKSKNIGSLVELSKELYLHDFDFRLVLCGEGDFFSQENSSDFHFLELKGYKNGAELAKEAADCVAMITTGRIGLLATDSFALRLPIIGLNKDVQNAPEVEYLNETNSILCGSLSEMTANVKMLMNSPHLVEKLKNGCDNSCRLYSVEHSAQIIFDFLLPFLAKE